MEHLEPGESHQYELRCVICGQAGTFVVSVVPATVSVSDLHPRSGQPGAGPSTLEIPTGKGVERAQRASLDGGVA